MFYQLRAIRFNRGGVEVEPFGIFLEFDFLETFDRMLRGFGQIGDAFNRAAVEFLHHHIVDVVVAERIGRGEDLGEDDDFATVGGEFVLEGLVGRRKLSRGEATYQAAERPRSYGN